MERDHRKNSGESPAKTPGTAPGKAATTAASKTAGKAAAKAPKPYERPRGGQARSISDLMPNIGRTAFRRFGFVQSSVVTRWPEIVGPRHARVCMPEAIRFPPGEKSDGILQLVVRPAHAPLIQHVVPEIMERVNRFFGYKAVAKVKIRQGEVKAPPASPKRTAPPSLKPVPFELGESLRDIGDPELRAVLESLARSMSAKEDRKDD
ncbi:DciA family protein [Novosphingobium sp. 1949]|uniref:DciA family protein n=1 Tax=Novosphingobium organovorum TaxID=2930092 RepID=A0ABT0BEU9_9SPHN|nr:DciA family protein [Novosphingobium organovorum]MCJ2183549.1 DciA family protein [Novosphingobium organovorum]